MLPENRKYQSVKQQGFVLVLALVMLAVMTLIGVSSMNSANMELKATANARQHQSAFNAAQSLLEYSISVTGISDASLDFQTNDTAVQIVTKAIDGIDISGSVKHVGCTVGVGSSIEAGRGFSYNFYSIEADGVNKAGTTAGTAKSIQVQGIRYPAAACG